MRRFGIAACAGALCAAIAVPAAEHKATIQGDGKTSARDTAASPTTHKANDMIGSSVQTKGGEKLGIVRDFAFTLPSGDLAYVIVASGGILGLGAEYHAVPPQAFSHETQNPKVLALETSKGKWEAAPKFKKDQLPNLNTYREQLDKYFEGSNDAKAQVKIGDARAEIKVKTPDIRAGVKKKGEALHLASDVIGKSVVAKNNDDIGKVSDLLVDMRAPSIAFAIISTGTLLKPTDARYAIATKNFSVGSEKGKVVLNADRAMLENAERFDPIKWRNSKTSAGYFKYDEAEGKVEIAIDDTKKNDAEVTIKTSSDAGATALSLLKEGNRYVGEQAKDKLVQIRSERSRNGLKPTVWYVVFYDPTAALKATEVKFINGRMTDVKRPLRLLEATSDRSGMLDRSKIKLDSDQALEMALKEPALQSAKPLSSEMRLERGEADEPIWKIQLWGSKADDSNDDVNLGTVTLSAQDGKVINNDLKTSN